MKFDLDNSLMKGININGELRRTKKAIEQKKLYVETDKVKLRVIGGRLPAEIGGGPTVPEMVQAGNAMGPKILGQPVAEVANDKFNQKTGFFHNRVIQAWKIRFFYDGRYKR